MDHVIPSQKPKRKTCLSQLGRRQESYEDRFGVRISKRFFTPVTPEMEAWIVRYAASNPDVSCSRVGFEALAMFMLVQMGEAAITYFDVNDMPPPRLVPGIRYGAGNCSVMLLEDGSLSILGALPTASNSRVMKREVLKVIPAAEQFLENRKIEAAKKVAVEEKAIASAAASGELF